MPLKKDSEMIKKITGLIDEKMRGESLISRETAKEYIKKNFKQIDKIWLVNSEDSLGLPTKNVVVKKVDGSFFCSCIEYIATYSKTRGECRHISEVKKNMGELLPFYDTEREKYGMALSIDSEEFLESIGYEVANRESVNVDIGEKEVIEESTNDELGLIDHKVESESYVALERDNEVIDDLGALSIQEEDNETSLFYDNDLDLSDSDVDLSFLDDRDDDEEEYEL